MNLSPSKLGNKEISTGAIYHGAAPPGSRKSGCCPRFCQRRKWSSWRNPTAAGKENQCEVKQHKVTSIVFSFRMIYLCFYFPLIDQTLPNPIKFSCRKKKILVTQLWSFNWSLRTFLLILTYSPRQCYLPAASSGWLPSAPHPPPERAGWVRLRSGWICEQKVSSSPGLEAEFRTKLNGWRV